jgi:hypothetical protein
MCCHFLRSASSSLQIAGSPFTVPHVAKRVANLYAFVSRQFVVVLSKQAVILLQFNYLAYNSVSFRKRFALAFLLLS